MKHPDRIAREAAALRANLLKRKAQVRQREAGTRQPEDPGASPHDTTRSPARAQDTEGHDAKRDS